MIKLAKSMNTKDLWLYIVYALILTGLLFCGLHGSISASSAVPPRTYPLYDFSSSLRPRHRGTAYQYRQQNSSANQSAQNSAAQPAATQVRVKRHRHRRHLRLASVQQNNPSAHTANSSTAQATAQKPVIRHRHHRRHAKLAAQKPANVTPQTNGQTIANIPVHHYKKWFRDGLNDDELSARNWITYHESGDNWKVVSYGGRCIGYFQLDPSYLGYKNGKVNLGHHHQVKVADLYVQTRYGDWINAKQFWLSHNWY